MTLCSRIFPREWTQISSLLGSRQSVGKGQTTPRHSTINSETRLSSFHRLRTNFCSPFYLNDELSDCNSPGMCKLQCAGVVEIPTVTCLEPLFHSRRNPPGEVRGPPCPRAQKPPRCHRERQVHWNLRQRCMCSQIDSGGPSHSLTSTLGSLLGPWRDRTIRVEGAHGFRPRILRSH